MKCVHIIMIYLRSELRLPVCSIRAIMTKKPKPKQSSARPLYCYFTI
jgi:hypothetical protein